MPLLPRILDAFGGRPVMIDGIAFLVARGALVPLVGSIGAVILLWAVIGFGFSLTHPFTTRIVTPTRTSRPAPTRTAIRVSSTIGTGGGRTPDKRERKRAARQRNGTCPWSEPHVQGESCPADGPSDGTTMECIHGVGPVACQPSRR